VTAALVIGGAACVWGDIETALDLGEFDGVVGCNHVGIHWPGRLDAYVSLHPDKLKMWAARRALKGLPPHKALVGSQDTSRRFPGQDKPGSSGLFALKVALDDLGYDRAVLCGIPLEPEAAHFDNPAVWKAALHYREGWIQALPHISDRTRSMGGWTAQMLGRPTPEWIRGT
jgi:hypothetical protein